MQKVTVYSNYMVVSFPDRAEGIAETMVKYSLQGSLDNLASALYSTMIKDDMFRELVLLAAFNYKYEFPEEAADVENGFHK